VGQQSVQTAVAEMEPCVPSLFHSWPAVLVNTRGRAPFNSLWSRGEGQFSGTATEDDRALSAYAICLSCPIRAAEMTNFAIFGRVTGRIT
jgi:hypothetical protein